jgi:hypothetical protein
LNCPSGSIKRHVARQCSQWLEQSTGKNSKGYRPESLLAVKPDHLEKRFTTNQRQLNVEGFHHGLARAERHRTPWLGITQRCHRARARLVKPPAQIGFERLGGWIAK